MMWSGTIKIIRDAPLLGAGIGSWQWMYQRYKDPGIKSEPDFAHNDFLNLAADYGLVGAGIMLAVVGCFFRHAWGIARTGRTTEQRAFSIGAMISVISILVHSWFDFNLHIPANSLLLAAILGFTAAIGNQPRQVLGNQTQTYLRYVTGLAILCVCGIGLYFFSPTLLAFHYTDKGNGSKMQLDYDSAFLHYGHASALDPKYPKPHIKAGEIYLSSANWRRTPAKAQERREFAHKAINAYQRALSLNPYQAFVHVNKGQAHELAGEDELALQSYHQAIEIAPGNAYAHFMMGRYYRERGENEKALESFGKANVLFHYNEETFQINYWEAYEQRGAAQPR